MGIAMNFDDDDGPTKSERINALEQRQDATERFLAGLDAALRRWARDPALSARLDELDRPGEVGFVFRDEPIGTAQERIDRALGYIRQYGSIDGAHHKQWVLDQVVRSLTGNQYEEWVRAQKAGEDGPDTYEWDEGIAP